MSLATRVEGILVELADCLCREIAERQMPEPCFCGVLPGEDAALVYCNVCEGGQAWVRLTGIGTPTSELELSLNRCAGLLAIGIEMGMVHGYLPVDEDGEPVDMSTALAQSGRQLQEMDTMYHVLTCCRLTIDERVSGLAYVPVSDGTCLGGIWTGVVPVL